MSAPACSFVIPVYEAFAATRDLLLSLRATLPNLRCEIILVDDASPSPDLQAWLDSQTDLRLLRHRANQGFAQTVNDGIEAARSDTVCLLNSDLLLRPGWFEPLLATLQADSRRAIVGNVQIAHAYGRIDHLGKYFDADGMPQHLDHRLLPYWYPTPDAPTIDCPALTAACWLLRKQTFIEHGAFDTAYRNGYEDDDFCLRLSQSTGATFACCWASQVYHHVSLSPGRKTHEDANTARFRNTWAEHARTWHAEHFTPWLAAIQPHCPQVKYPYALRENLIR